MSDVALYRSFLYKIDLLTAICSFAIIGGQNLYGESIVKMGPEMAANAPTSTSETNVVSGISSQGMHIFAWQQAESDGTAGIVVRRFDKNGIPLAAAVNVHPSLTGVQDQPSLSVANDGSFVVVYRTNHLRNNDNTDVFYSRFDSTGTIIGSPTKINTVTTTKFNTPKVSINKTTKEFVVTYTYGDSASQQKIALKRFNSSGVSQDTTQVELTSDRSGDNPAVAFSENGKFVASWEEESTPGSGTSPWQIAYRMYTFSTGAAVNNKTKASGTNDVNQVDVACNAAGNFILSWIDGFPLSGTTALGIVYRKINTDGTLVGISPTVLHANATGGSGYRTNAPRVRVGLDSSNNFYTAFQNNNLTQAKFYDSSAAFNVSTDTTPPKIAPVISMMPSGKRGIIAWEGTGIGDTYGIYFQRFTQPNVAPVIADLPTLEYYGNPTFEFTVSATDSNDLDVISYSIEAPIPSGCNINSTTGKVTWTPTSGQKGTIVNLTIKAADDANPSAFSNKTFPIKILQYQSDVKSWELY